MKSVFREAVRAPVVLASLPAAPAALTLPTTAASTVTAAPAAKVTARGWARVGSAAGGLGLGDPLVRLGDEVGGAVEVRPDDAILEEGAHVEVGGTGTVLACPTDRDGVQNPPVRGGRLDGTDDLTIGKGLGYLPNEGRAGGIGRRGVVAHGFVLVLSQKALYTGKGKLSASVSSWWFKAIKASRSSRGSKRVLSTPSKP